MSDGMTAVLIIVTFFLVGIFVFVWFSLRAARDRSAERRGRRLTTAAEHAEPADEPADEPPGSHSHGTDEQRRWTDTGGPAEGLPPRIVRDPRRFDRATAAPYSDGDPRPVMSASDPAGLFTDSYPRHAGAGGEGTVDPPRAVDPAAVVDPNTWSQPGRQAGEPLTGVPELDRSYGSVSAPPPDPTPPPSTPDPPPSPTYDQGGYSGGGSSASDYGGGSYNP